MSAQRRNPFRIGRVSPMGRRRAFVGPIRGPLLGILAASALLAAGCAASAQQPRSGEEVSVVRSPAGSGPEETTYEIRSGPCRIGWTVWGSGVNRGIARRRADCRLPLSEQIALDAKIHDKALDGGPIFRTLDFGRLERFPEISARMAAEAVRSPEWDARRGRPKSSQSANRFLQDLFASSGSGVFSEWRRLFEERGLTFAVSGVEEVSVGAAGALPYFPGLAARGVTAADRAPYDGSVWFSLARRQ